MKKLLFTISSGLALLIVSCNDNKTAAGGETNAAAQKNLDAVHGINKAIETGDVSKLGDYIAVDAVDHAGEHGDIKGLDSIKAQLAMIHTMVTDMKSETIKELADNDYVFEWMKYSGTCTVQMGAMAPGTHMEMSAMQVSKMKDGKAVEHWEMMTMGEFMKMMPANMPGPGKGSMDTKMDNKMMDTTHKK